ncbi:MAG: ATP-binding cassette domain-containing protein [Roseibium sp.]|uniref:ABC-F family ATP-binding cassette domain-containing protein n=1 Tax=Roseibium sp. TaxID=1936156 RepID=UPI0026051305|nr:ABC-F family ATP-binding cassette domain-containing protein [Roseibium sp.]MCV0426328.1 ATP-binding cassette domain-containing protein [Roseibium sp.]
MTLINLRNAGVTLSAPLFSDVNLTIGKADRIGLVAANGSGKSTLLRAVAGETEFTQGELTTARGLRIGFVSQDVPEELLAKSFYEAVLSALDPDQAENESWRVDIALADLDVPGELWQRPLAALSGGWQRVALLARTWVSEPDVLLIDEPTNHLDLGRIGLLQRWFETIARGTPLVVASHDRAFLDAVTNRTFFLRPEQSFEFALPYSMARQALDEIDAAAARQFEKDIGKANQLRRQAAKLKNIGINSGSDLLLTKTKQLKERADKIEGSARPAGGERPAGSIRLANSGTHAKSLVAIEETEIVVPDGPTLFETGRLWINRGDRIVVLGTNGSGKTCLLSRVIRALTGEDADIRVSPTVVPGVSDQALSQLDRFTTPMDAITKNSDVGDRTARALLAAAGISIELQDRRISVLSGGQRSRIAMLILRLAEPNFYILDEPTNHLDIEGQEALELELLKQGATALLVSHDRTFVRNVGTRYWLIEGRRLVEVDDPETFFARQLE